MLPDRNREAGGRHRPRRADLAVIIVSYNCAEWLPACLSSVYAHAGDARIEVVVVDNNSADGSAELVEREFRTATVIRRPNHGFAAGNNAGLVAVDADYVLFLNADTEILDGTFGELLGLLEARPAVGLAGCRQVTADGDLYPTIRRFPTALRYFCEAIGAERLPFDASWLGERVRNQALYDREISCDWTLGSFMLARREAVLAAGGLDERYFLYCEEPDLCLRLKGLGWDVRHLPAMTILHHAGKAGFSQRLVAQDAYARRQYMEKNMSPVQRRLALAAFAFGHLLRAGFLSADSARRHARRSCARAAIGTLVGTLPPPFATATADRPADDGALGRPLAGSGLGGG